MESHKDSRATVNEYCKETCSDLLIFFPVEYDNLIALCQLNYRWTAFLRSHIEDRKLWYIFSTIAASDKRLIIKIFLFIIHSIQGKYMLNENSILFYQHSEHSDSSHLSLQNNSPTANARKPFYLTICYIVFAFSNRLMIIFCQLSKLLCALYCHSLSYTPFPRQKWHISVWVNSTKSIHTHITFALYTLMQ